MSDTQTNAAILQDLRNKYPGKFASQETIFNNIHRGDRIFIGTACGEPQYLVQALIHYVESHPKAFFDAEVLHVWTLGIAPYTDIKFKHNFRHNSFFIGNNTRESVNQGLADYTPISLSGVPDLFRRGLVPVDIALIQMSPPDRHGFMSLGVSVDIVKAAVESARIVVAQVNSFMPRVHGDAFINIENIHYILPHDEPLLEYEPQVHDEIAQRIGGHVARLIKDGDTIQVGYGSLPNAILANLADKKHLGIHTELLTDGVVDLMKRGVVDNTRKTLHEGKAVATFCMGKKETYEFINDNPGVEFHPIDYTNSPLIISKIDNMVAINSGLEIDLTGQATAESLGRTFYSGIGGQADFMRGARYSKNGKTILTIQSTAHDGKVSRIVPLLSKGAGVTLIRSDVQYVISEYGIAYLYGKNVRERAMSLISIAHPKFRPWLVEEAKKINLIYKDQAFIPGKRGEYPEELETFRTTSQGLELYLRPVKISDEPLLKDFFYALTDKSLYRRFISSRKDMPHERLQEFVIIDYTRELILLAETVQDEKQIIVGLAQYGIDESAHVAEAAVVVRDDWHNKGIGTVLISHLTFLAKKNGLLGFTAEVLRENKNVLRVIEKMNYDVERRDVEGVYEIRMTFR